MFFVREGPLFGLPTLFTVRVYERMNGTEWAVNGQFHSKDQQLESIIGKINPKAPRVIEVGFGMEKREGAGEALVLPPDFTASRNCKSVLGN